MALVAQHPSFFYDIEARSPGPDAPTEDEARVMLRALLADRFQLTLHHDTRNLSYYALVVGKNGTKLIPAKTDCQQQHDTAGGAGDTRSTALHVCNQSMDQLTRIVGGRTEQPVVDENRPDWKFRL